MMVFKLHTTHSIVLLLCLVCLNSSCGFKLKQAYEFNSDIKTLSIKSNSINPGFLHTLEKSLEANGITVTDDAPTQLNILSYTISRHAASINTSNARQTETRLTHSIKYSLTQATELLVSPVTISRSEEYFNDNSNISGKVAEERLLSKNLDQEIADLILLRLANYKTQTTQTADGN